MSQKKNGAGVCPKQLQQNYRDPYDNFKEFHEQSRIPRYKSHLRRVCLYNIINLQVQTSVGSYVSRPLAPQSLKQL